MRIKFNIKTFKIMEQTAATMQIRESKPRLHIIFLHGGAYVQEAFPAHWKLMRIFIEKLNCRLTFIDYPLAPKYQYKQTFAMLEQTYGKLTNDYAQDDFIFVGDSAGGGLALAFLQKLKNESGIMPKKTVLFSPWLDLSMANPLAKEVEHTDLLLTVDGLIRDGKLYAGGDDVLLPLLSPINGSFDGLGDVAVFFGTHELFLPDCLLLKEKVKNSDSRFKFIGYPEMQHDFVLFPIPEAKKAIDEACQFISDK